MPRNQDQGAGPGDGPIVPRYQPPGGGGGVPASPTPPVPPPTPPAPAPRQRPVRPEPAPAPRPPRQRPVRPEPSLQDPPPPPPPPPPPAPPVTPDWDVPSPAEPASVREMTIDGEPGTLRLIYGSTRVGGRIVYRAVNSAGRLVVCYLICHGPVSSINTATIKVGGKTLSELFLTASGTDYEVFLGTSSQSVSSILSSVETQWDSRRPGVAYVVLAFRQPSENGLVPEVNPRDFTCVVEGKTVRDHRSDATLATRYYRTNPALALADLLTSKRYGAGIPDAQIDWDSVDDAADFCDYDIDPGGGTTKRYEIGISLDVADSVESAVGNLRAHAQLFVAYNNGKYQIIADQAKAVSGITFTDTGDGEHIVDARLRVRGAGDVPSHVVVNYTDVASDYKDGRVEVERDGIAAGTLERVTATFDLRGCCTFDQAKRIAIYLLNRVLLDKDITLRVGARGAEVIPGDIIEVTSAQLNFAAQKVLVTSCSPTEGIEWSIGGELYDAAIYSDTIQTRTATIVPVIPSPYDVPPWPGGVAFDEKTTPDDVQTTTWETVPVRSTDTWGAAYWSTVNCGNVTLANINDGAYGVKALDLNVAGESAITLDLGVGDTRAFREVVVSQSGSHFLTIQYSDDGSAWTLVGSMGGSGTWALVDSSGGAPDVGYTRKVLALSDVGTHRYWRVIQTNPGASAIDIAEVQFYEWLSEWPYAESVVLCGFGGDPSTDAVASELPAVRSISTQELGSFAYSGVNQSGYTKTFSLQIHTRSRAGLIGYGLGDFGVSAAAASLNGWAPDYLLHGQGALSLANGANNDVAVPSTVTLLRVTGPTGAFSITGLVAKDGTNNTDEGGRLFVIENASGQVMTLVHNATSAAANRISCPKSMDRVVASGERVVVSYDSTASLWLVLPAGPTILKGSATWNPASKAAGLAAGTTVTVTGAAVGDAVIVNTDGEPFAGGYAMTLSGYVSAANTVTVVMGNGSEITQDIPSFTVYVTVIK